MFHVPDFIDGLPQPVKVDHTGRLSLLKIRGLFIVLKTVRTLFTEKSRNPPMVIKSHKSHIP